SPSPEPGSDPSIHPCQAGNNSLSHRQKSFVHQTNSALNTTNPTKNPPQKSARTAFSFDRLDRISLARAIRQSAK
ncbi:hypothetical protein PspLS_09417, partial [Pyricularia sp. CBS 133598]